ncbi:uncharacterized protein LOC116020751 [Ipomoea triloba]|uniref:uncharacterized protein LOC116020751 n=1 Tax=Ipomoea triloba TaxID=35885 RepID=UPI00125E33F1|nr:uncharacterized protein LOC116020751 [Ipomoea triloba]
MAMQINPNFSMLTPNSSVNHRIATGIPQITLKSKPSLGLELGKRRAGIFSVRCSEKAAQTTLRTCKNCKTQFDPLLNHPRACRYHTAHFGGETKRKFESVYTGGTMNTPDSGKILEYWHCCGSEDSSDPGCTAAPHASYDD